MELFWGFRENPDARSKAFSLRSNVESGPGDEDSVICKLGKLDVQVIKLQTLDLWCDSDLFSHEFHGWGE